MIKADQFEMPLSAREVWRVNRIRLAEHFQISPLEVDRWDIQTYYDALEVRAADEVIQKLNS